MMKILWGFRIIDVDVDIEDTGAGHAPLGQPVNYLLIYYYK